MLSIRVLLSVGGIMKLLYRTDLVMSSQQPVDHEDLYEGHS